MATYTTNLNLKKPSDDDYFNIDDFNDNFDTIDSQVNGKLSKTSSFTSGNLLEFNSSGQICDSGKKVSDFMLSNATCASIGADVAGSASSVQNNLTAHIQDGSKHLTSQMSTKLSKAYTTDNIIISDTQPTAVEGTIWIKVI